MVLAIGNAGGNIIETISKESNNSKLKDAHYAFADSDEKDLNKHMSDNYQLILLNADDEKFSDDIFDGIEELVIVVGLGGLTGTKFTNLAVKSATEAGIAHINVVATTPFTFEGNDRINLATLAAQKLSNIGAVNVTIFNNENLLTKYPNLNFFNAFEAADKEIMKIVEDTF